MFEETDRNNNGVVGGRELTKALRFTAKAYDYTPTEKDIEWVKSTAEKFAAENGKKKSLDKAEFA